MAAKQAEDVRAFFLFLGDLNGNHQELLGSTTTNRHGVAAFDFATVSGSDQLVVFPANVSGGTLDHRVDTVIESSLWEIIGSKNFALINLSLNF